MIIERIDTDRNHQQSSTTDPPSSLSSSPLLRDRGSIETHHRSSFHKKDDDSLSSRRLLRPHGVSSTFSRLLRQYKDRYPLPIARLLSFRFSVFSRLLPQKSDRNPQISDVSVSLLHKQSQRRRQGTSLCIGFVSTRHNGNKLTLLVEGDVNKPTGLRSTVNHFLRVSLRDKEVTRLGLGYASKRGHEMVSLLKSSHEI
ncbi:hypothetical protein F2Q69_00041705 [Brassica cretica]|uniref:Uncharacterized protein n=1 Tax=Brassica cretica TaxID=69181 RepID=A0A8S9NFG9_BRACR|nr:hypothetical protein F2Q69_00041705 [Brassica cretica]